RHRRCRGRTRGARPRPLLQRGPSRRPARGGRRAPPRGDRHLAPQRRQLRLPRHGVLPAPLPRGGPGVPRGERGANRDRRRGCHYKCTFCAYPVIEGRGMRTRDPEGIAAEVAALLDAHGIDQFFVVDSVFNAPRGYAERVCAALRPLGQRARWSCFVTPGNFSAALLDAMITAGCQSIDFGTDAGSDRTLRAFRKSFNVDDIRAASAICRARGFPFCHSLVFGGEGESWETVAETIALMDECRPTAVTAMCGVRVYPETPIALALLARGEVPG